MAGKKLPGFATKFAITVSVLLLSANIFLGFMLTDTSRSALKILIQNRMLDISNTAADMLDGDILKNLKAEDKGSEEYQKINDTLAFFQNNIDLKYIYCVHDDGDKHFSFTVDPTIEDPGIFGDPVVYTDALYAASKGKPSVDEEPYTDDWGRFYSSYSPVFDSEGKVAGIVAVDFSAQWYDEQISKQTHSILFSSMISIVLGVLLVLIATTRLRRQIKTIISELSDVAKDVDELTLEINPDAVQEPCETFHKDEVSALAARIHQVQEGLHTYTRNIHSQANSMITALSSEYRSVYYINLDENSGICYQAHSQLDNGLHQGEQFKYIETFTAYANAYVTEKYRADFLNFVNPNSVRQALEHERIITFRYMINRNGIESYEMMRIAGVRHPEDRDDHIVHAIGLGFTDVDAETRRTLTQSQALRDALSAAESANSAKTAFLSNMSHEIRTPMNAIIGLNRIALSDQTISSETREYLEKIGTSADHLLDIINDILDMSRIEAGRMVLREEVFSLSELLEQINVMIGSQCKEKNLTWKQEIQKSSFDYYVGDDMRLKEIMINILGNAVKFTPEGGEVSFSVEQIQHYDGKSVFRFVIKDTGIGMSQDFLSKLFDPFSQEDFSTKTKYGSTGLGMSITKSIVEMMNGEIQVESQKGKGSTFTVTLTLTDSDKQNCESEEQDKLQDETKNKADLKGRHILVAEDMDVNAEIILMVLQIREMEAERAQNGKIAVEKFNGKPEGYYDAILMDMRMPEMDGLEATRAIRALDRKDAKTIPIIALTANAFDEDVQRSLQSGLNAHLSKPIDAELLYETLERLIEN
ncbi:ATP-binding protein [uncultured Treponema sp.]|uniref:ATP-binding protein n=1 Tax=uncultured Treponema sp. TaxID=162155 RepID=UPI0025FFA392|nr:ATP-binding protein [uncultured Treponema sp.]